MRSTLSRRLNLAKIVLHELNKTPTNRTQLEKKATRKCGTHASFESILHFLKENGYLEKTAQRHRAPYRITEKGRKLLEGL